MYTYFFTNNINSYIKIGKSISPRCRSLQVAGQCSFVKIGIFYTIEGDFESQFQLIYSGKRVCGEWYNIPNLSIEELECHLQSILSKRAL